MVLQARTTDKEPEMQETTYQITAIIDGARQVWTVKAFTEDEAHDLYYDVARSDTDELIAIDPA